MTTCPCVPVLEITCYADTSPRFILERPCLNPGPHCAFAALCCPFCAAPIDDGGRCDNVDCFFWRQLVPLPEWRATGTNQRPLERTW